MLPGARSVHRDLHRQPHQAKCDKLAAELAPKTTTKITTAQVDADKTEEVIALIQAYQPDLVMNIALPYQDLTIMDACLACGVNYMDTANYEPENTDDPEWRASTRSAARKPVSLPTLITAGSGLRQKV